MVSLGPYCALQPWLSSPLDAQTCTALSALVLRAREHWPGVDVAPEHWTRAVGLAIGDEEPSRWGVLVRSLDARGLWLSCAVLAGHRAASAKFDALLVSVAGQVLHRFRVRSDHHDELVQRIRVRVMVPTGPDKPAKLAHYRGRGSLPGWLRVVASRVVMNDRRGLPRGDVDVDLEVLWTTAMPIEPAHRRQVQRSTFSKLVREAFQSLTPRQRGLMRLRHVRGLTVTTIGRAYQVDPSTVSRWLGQARDALRNNFQLVARTQCVHTLSVEAMISAGMSECEGSLRSIMASASAPVDADARWVTSAASG